MIISFLSDTAKDIYDGIDSRQARRIPEYLWRMAQRKFDMLNAAIHLKDLRTPPGNRLEALKGKMKEKFSIRINDQYRIVFEFKDGNAYEVDVVDYH